MTELITIILTVVGVGLALATINITTFLYLLGRLSSVEKEVAIIHGLLEGLRKAITHPSAA